ncbi:hypothetical protein FOQG_17654 [Fusarium oxysporum f. sp. raphani 54005]|uniref:Uncharacterized protein n=1 Tax=Fusarium oxysporum f. sp. raphani 54005 TaxID=1089458 RepID=X0BGN4_FUSOX|nr:hypothetical protein FOQG_17654 [Fusarium oxysporum f. sp. raphani 54005]
MERLWRRSRSRKKRTRRQSPRRGRAADEKRVLTRRMSEKSRSLRDHQPAGGRDDLGKHRRKKPLNQHQHPYQNPGLDPSQKQ